MAAAVSSVSRLRVKGRARADGRGLGAPTRRRSAAPAIRVHLSRAAAPDEQPHPGHEHRDDEKRG